MMTKLDRHIFCDSADPSTAIPWLDYGTAFATDGVSIAIQCTPEFAGLPVADASERRPEVAEVIKVAKSVTAWDQMPAVPKCEVCGLSGLAKLQTCDICKGTGVLAEHDDDACVECVCGIVADSPCILCSARRVIVCGVRIRRIYAAALARLPGIQVAKPDDGFVAFRFDHGFGMVGGQ